MLLAVLITSYAEIIYRIYSLIKKDYLCYAILVSGVHHYMHTQTECLRKNVRYVKIRELGFSQYPTTKCIFDYGLRKRGTILDSLNASGFVRIRQWTQLVQRVLYFWLLKHALKSSTWRGRKVTYEFIDTYHYTCLYKRDIITAQLRACEKLIEYSRDEGDKSQILSVLHMLGLTLLLQPNLSSSSFVFVCFFDYLNPLVMS